MTSKQLETKLREEIHDDIRIIEHPKLAGLSNVFWRAIEVCPCPTFDVREKYDASYRFEFPNGVSAEHNSEEMVRAKVQGYIDFMESEEGQKLLEDEAKPEAKVNFVDAPLNITPIE